VTTCSLILGVIACLATAPRPTPAEAVNVLTASVRPFVYVERSSPAPFVVFPLLAPSSGPWTWPTPMPDRRLDGTLWTDPPSVMRWRVPRRTR